LIVSGFFTSPNDHERIRSGDANAILIASKSGVWRCWLKRLSRSFISYLREEESLVEGGRCESFSGTRDPRSRVTLSTSVLLELHVDGQRADFLDQDVEGLRHAGDHLVLAVDAVLVHLVATLHVVGLHRDR